MRLRRLILIILFGALLLTPPASAHEVRPAFLDIQQTGSTTYKIIWKQPTLGEVAVHLAPHLSNGWLERTPNDQYAAGGFLIRSWTINASAGELVGAHVTIEGLPDTMTDTLVRVRFSDGRGIDAIARPEDPTVAIAVGNKIKPTMADFLRLGIEHIATGPDHLLFVFGLLLIVQGRLALIKTISAFTAAHSVALAFATLGGVAVSNALLNALIGLSILFLAPEIMRARRGETSLTLRYPWLVAFAFGLVHGLAFAGGLTELGLDRATLLAALVLFNVGVEIGQLAFVALALSIWAGLGRLNLRWPAAAEAAPVYAIGSMGVFWTLQSSANLFGVGS